MATYGTYNSPGPFKLTVYGVVIAACFFVMFYMVRRSYREYQAPPINHARALERIKARQELTTKAISNLTTLGCWWSLSSLLCRLGTTVARHIHVLMMMT